MNKIRLIIAREYLTRVRKKTFLIMTILGPILFGSMIFVPVWLSNMDDQDVKSIAVVEYDRYGQPVPDSLMLFKGVIPNKEKLRFQYLGNIEFRTIEPILRNSEYYGFLVLRHDVLYTGKNVYAELYTKKQPGLPVNVHISKSLEQFIHDSKLLKYSIPAEVMENIRTNVDLRTIKLDKDKGFEEQKFMELKLIIGYLSGFLIYMFVFMFGVQVLRGVIEEKTNRIVEVIVTSVKPVQLMAGKIIGIGLVGLTQYLIWVILTFGVYQFGTNYLVQKNFQQQMTEQKATGLFSEQAAPPTTNNMAVMGSEVKELELLSAIQGIPFVRIIICFGLFFIGGYLLYGSVFAAIGSAVDSETDTQQFMMPVTIPLIISLLVMYSAVSNPDSQIAFWFSIIPFTSPIVMMARIPYDVPLPTLLLSIGLLYATIVLFIWISAKIYRTGILMYGKKPSYKEIIKWIRYK